MLGTLGLLLDISVCPSLIMFNISITAGSYLFRTTHCRWVCMGGLGRISDRPTSYTDLNLLVH